MSVRWHFGAYRHRDGVLLLAADSVVGLLRHLERECPSASFAEVADMIEELADRGQP